jgi:hypothetical protein
MWVKMTINDTDYDMRNIINIFKKVKVVKGSMKSPLFVGWNDVQLETLIKACDIFEIPSSTNTPVGSPQFESLPTADDEGVETQKDKSSGIKIKEQAKKLQMEDNVRVVYDGERKTGRIILLPHRSGDTNSNLLSVPVACKACMQGEPDPDMLLVMEGKLEVTSLGNITKSKISKSKSSVEYFSDLGNPLTVLNENEFYTSLKNTTIMTSGSSTSPFSLEQITSITTTIHTFSKYTAVSVHPRTRILFVGLGVVHLIAKTYGIKI